jgi:hypothetical protein
VTNQKDKCLKTHWRRISPAVLASFDTMETVSTAAHLELGRGTQGRRGGGQAVAGAQGEGRSRAPLRLSDGRGGRPGPQVAQTPDTPNQKPLGPPAGQDGAFMARSQRLGSR